MPFDCSGFLSLVAMCSLTSLTVCPDLEFRKVGLFVPKTDLLFRYPLRIRWGTERNCSWQDDSEFRGEAVIPDKQSSSMSLDDSTRDPEPNAVSRDIGQLCRRRSKALVEDFLRQAVLDALSPISN